MPPVKTFLPPPEFFRYWRAIPTELLDRVIVYVYRSLPIVDYLQPLPKEEQEEIRQKKRRRPLTNLGKFVDPMKWDPDNYARYCVELWGAGDYTFRLNDQHPSVKKTWCQTVTSGEPPLRDWDSHRPLLDPLSVVLTEKQNESYIRWARSNNVRLFGDPGEPGASAATAEEDKEDMANVAAVEKLADALVESTRDRGKSAQQQSGAAPDFSAQAGQKVLNILEDASLKAGEMQARAFRQAQEMHDPAKVLELVEKLSSARNGNSGGDTLAVMKDLIVSDRQRAADEIRSVREQSLRENERTEKFYAMMLKQNQDRMDSLERTLSDLRAAPPAAAATGEKFSLLNALEELSKVRGKIDELMGGGDGKRSDNPWVNLLQENLPEILDFGKVLTGNIVAFKNSAPPVTPATVIETRQEPEEQTPVVQDTPQMQLLKMIHGPMMQMIREGRPGWDFAGLIIEQQGQQAYTYIANLRAEGILSMMQTYAPLWADLMNPAVGPVRTQQFVAEFLESAKAIQSAEAIRVARQQQTGRARRPAVDPATPTKEHPGPTITP